MKWIKKALPFLFSSWDIKPGHEMDFVFESGGIEYYRFTNEFNIPYARAMAAADIYAELDQKVDSKYTKLSFETIIEFLKQGNNIGAGVVATNALERMNNITNMDLMYKLASVLYIDKKENPYSYDTEYNDKKIKHWQQDKDIQGFFFKTPLADYLPSFDGLPMSMMDYTKAQRERLLQTLKNHLSMLSVKGKKVELISTLELQIKELEELVTNS
jgi:hypothetical protein